MTVKQINGEWWIVDKVYGIPDHGPYKTKQAAEEGCAGLNRTIKSHPTIFKCVECAGTQEEEYLPGKFRLCRVCKGERK